MGVTVVPTGNDNPAIDLSITDIGVGVSGQGGNTKTTFLSYDSGPVQKFSGGTGTANQLNLNVLNLGGWKFQAYDDGVYVTTPSGIITKLELVDTRYVPIPEPVALMNVNLRAPESFKNIPGGASKSPGGQTGGGNSIGGGGAVGAAPGTPGEPFNAPEGLKILPAVDASGFSACSNTAQALLPPSMNNVDFISGLNKIAELKNVAADSILTSMQIASGFTNVDIPNFGAGAINLITQASGLIQMVPDTAKLLGYATDQIQNMTATEQLLGPITSLFNHITFPTFPSTTDLFLANFYPAAVGKLDTYILGNIPGIGSPQQIAAANPAFQNQDGLVSVGSIKKWIATNYPAAT